MTLTLPTLPVLPDFPPTAACAACGGKCCRSMPCALDPSDIPQLTPAVVALMLRSRRYAIDWWEGDPREDPPAGAAVMRGYYLRPATTDADRWPLDASWGGVCVFLGPSGCELPQERRPREGRALEPGTEACVGHWQKRDAAVAWLPHHELLRRAVRLATRGERELP